VYTCPVCFYTGMQDPPRDYNICECCGTEFGNDDDVHTHEVLRVQWIDTGAKWFFRSAPVGWNPWTQLFMANVGALRYEGISTLYGGAVFETAKASPAATVAGSTYYGVVTMYGGNVLDAGTGTYAAIVTGQPYGAASTIYGGYVIDPTTNHAAQDVLAHAA